MFLSQFPSMFPLLTYSQSLIPLICRLPETLKKKEKQDFDSTNTGTVRGTAWYSLATRGLVIGGRFGGGVGSMVHCNSYSDD